MASLYEVIRFLNAVESIRNFPGLEEIDAGDGIFGQALSVVGAAAAATS